MRRNVFVLFIASGIMLMLSSIALANVRTGQITSIRTTGASGWTMIEVPGSSESACTDGSLNTPKISPSHAGYDKVISIATAAMLSGRDVTIDYADSGCVITWIRIE